jgi:chemotaxis protein CheC
MITQEEFDDALSELVNVGVGRAAASLNTMVREHIDLSVPRVVTCPYHALADQLGLTGDSLEEEHLSVVHQPFGGTLGGKASILFALESARNLVALLTDGDLSTAELDLEMEAVLTEVGNVLINGVIGTIGNITGIEIQFRLPEYHRCTSVELEESYRDREILVAIVLLSISGHQIRGHLILLFELASVENLREVIERLSGPRG